jgi:hypothetical protein
MTTKELIAELSPGGMPEHRAALVLGLLCDDWASRTSGPTQADWRLAVEALRTVNRKSMG